jgi:hypothetical protein
MKQIVVKIVRKFITNIVKAPIHLGIYVNQAHDNLVSQRLWHTTPGFRKGWKGYFFSEFNYPSLPYWRKANLKEVYRFYKKALRYYFRDLCYNYSRMDGLLPLQSTTQYMPEYLAKNIPNYTDIQFLLYRTAILFGCDLQYKYVK